MTLTTTVGVSGGRMQLARTAVSYCFNTGPISAYVSNRYYLPEGPLYFTFYVYDYLYPACEFYMMPSRAVLSLWPCAARVLHRLHQGERMVVGS